MDKTKALPLLIIFALLISIGAGVVIYQSSQSSSYSSESEQENIETVPSSTVQYSNAEEVTKTMPSYQSVKLKAIDLTSSVSSFKLKWKMKAIKTYRYTEISNDIKYKDESISKKSDVSDVKIKEYTVQKKITDFRLYYEQSGYGYTYIKINGEIVSDKIDVSEFDSYQSETIDITGMTIKEGDKIAIYGSSKQHCLESMPGMYGMCFDFLAVQNFQIKYNAIEKQSAQDVYYQIRINGIEKTSWTLVNSQTYKLVERNIHLQSVMEGFSVEIWAMSSSGVQVAIENMEICYSVRQNN